MTGSSNVDITRNAENRPKYLLLKIGFTVFLCELTLQKTVSSNQQILPVFAYFMKEKEQSYCRMEHFYT